MCIIKYGYFFSELRSYKIFNHAVVMVTDAIDAYMQVSPERPHFVFFSIILSNTNRFKYFCYMVCV